MIDVYVKFIKAHETILALVLATVVIFRVTNRIQSIEAKHDDTNLQTAQSVSPHRHRKTPQSPHKLRRIRRHSPHFRRRSTLRMQL